MLIQIEIIHCVQVFINERLIQLTDDPQGLDFLYNFCLKKL